ncbi:MAG: hypothetical protein SWY16_21105 [Cyanobacteriota bacterium]|nr:hypothetical protein [Cyanobacteriota bacterium]
MKNHPDPSNQCEVANTVDTIVLEPRLKPTYPNCESTRNRAQKTSQQIYRPPLSPHRPRSGERPARESTPLAASTSSSRNRSILVANIRKCPCPICQERSEHPQKIFHDRINLLLSRLDEQQRRWFVAILAQQLGRGGIQQISQVTGMHPDTIRRGRQELDRGLSDRPQGRTRLRGGGRRAKNKNLSKLDTTE